MKKLILTAIAVFTLTFVNAQDGGFAKGDIFVSDLLVITLHLQETLKITHSNLLRE